MMKCLRIGDIGLQEYNQFRLSCRHHWLGRVGIKWAWSHTRRTNCHKSGR